MRSPHRPISVAGALLVLTASLLPAQTIEGTLTDAATGLPISSAVVVLQEEASEVAAASTLSDDRGQFTLTASAAGRFRIVTERIGYRTYTGPAFPLADGEIRRETIAAPAEAITLEGITAVGDRRCRVRPAEGVAAARVWDEARKALSTALLAQRDQLVRYETQTFRRTLDPQHLQVTSEEVDARTGYGESPFVSVPIEELRDRGFIHSVDDGAYYNFFAPDAAVLLSDEFLDAHCMRVVEGEGERNGQVGLGFEPLDSREVPEIAGTFWLDRRSAVVRALEYRYTNLPWRISSDVIGGRVEFAQLPNGMLVVRRWRIRMPELDQLTTPSGAALRITRFREAGGEIVTVRLPGGQVVPMGQ